MIAALLVGYLIVALWSGRRFGWYIYRDELDGTASDSWGIGKSWLAGHLIGFFWPVCWPIEFIDRAQRRGDNLGVARLFFSIPSKEYKTLKAKALEDAK